MKKIMILVLFLILVSLPGWCQPIIPQCSVGIASGTILAALGGALKGGDAAQDFAAKYLALGAFAGRIRGVDITIWGASGNLGSVADTIIPSGCQFAIIIVTGDLYAGSAGTHVGRYLSVYNSSRIFPIFAADHSAGSNQGWIITSGSGHIYVTNKDGMSFEQSAQVLIIFF